MTKEEVIPSLPLFARYKPVPFIQPVARVGTIKTK